MRADGLGAIEGDICCRRAHRRTVLISLPPLLSQARPSIKAALSHCPSFVRDSRRCPRSLLFFHSSSLSLTKDAPIHHHIHSFACYVSTSEPGERGSSKAKHHIPGSDRLSQPAIPTLRVSKSPITGSLSESCELNNHIVVTTTLIPDRPSIPSHDLLSTIVIQPYPPPVWSRVATNQPRIAFRESVATYDADSCVLVNLFRPKGCSTTA